MEQIFINDDAQTFDELDVFPGASWTVLAEPVPQGSIHRLRMAEGTVIPPPGKGRTSPKPMSS